MRAGSLTRGVLAVAATALIGAGCGGGDDGESSSAEAEPQTIDELKTIVDSYNAETPLGENCKWQIPDNGAIEGAASVAEGAIAAEELKCADGYAAEISEFPDEARATDVAENVGTFRSGTLVVYIGQASYADEHAGVYEFIQQECDCGELPPA